MRITTLLLASLLLQPVDGGSQSHTDGRATFHHAGFESVQAVDYHPVVCGQWHPGETLAFVNHDAHSVDMGGPPQTSRATSLAASSRLGRKSLLNMLAETSMAITMSMPSRVMFSMLDEL